MDDVKKNFTPQERTQLIAEALDKTLQGAKKAGFDSTDAAEGLSLLCVQTVKPPHQHHLNLEGGTNRLHADLNAPTDQSGHMYGMPTIRPSEGIQSGKRGSSHCDAVGYGDLW